MPRSARRLTMPFSGLPVLGRCVPAAKVGIDAVGFLLWHALPAAEIQVRLEAHGPKPVLHEPPAGDADAGDRGIACEAARVAAFGAGVGRAIA